METLDVCSLCLQGKDSFSFEPLPDVNDYLLSQMTLNTIALIGPYKLCSKCCRELTFVGQLLFKWRQKIIVTLNLTKEETVIKKEEPIEPFSDFQNVICDNNWIVTEVDENYDSPVEFENWNNDGFEGDNEELYSVEQQYVELDGISYAKALVQLDREVIEEKGGVYGNLPDTGNANAIFARKRGGPRKAKPGIKKSEKVRVNDI